MSQSCLFKEQTTGYAFCYVVHILILVFEVFLWFVDFGFLWSWVAATRAGCDLRNIFRVFPVVAAVTTIVVVAWSQVSWKLK